MVSICMSELAYPSFVPVEGWHFGIWRHIWAWSGYLGTHMDPPKLGSSRQLWSQRLEMQAWPYHLLAVGPRADYAGNVSWPLGQYRKCLTTGPVAWEVLRRWQYIFQHMLTDSRSLS